MKVFSTFLTGIANVAALRYENNNSELLVVKKSLSENKTKLISLPSAISLIELKSEYGKVPHEIRYLSDADTKNDTKYEKVKVQNSESEKYMESDLSLLPIKVTNFTKPFSQCDFESNVEWSKIVMDFVVKFKSEKQQETSVKDKKTALEPSVLNLCNLQNSLKPTVRHQISGCKNLCSGKNDDSESYERCYLSSLEFLAYFKTYILDNTELLKITVPTEDMTFEDKTSVESLLSKSWWRTFSGVELRSLTESSTNTDTSSQVLQPLEPSVYSDHISKFLGECNDNSSLVYFFEGEEQTFKLSGTKNCGALYSSCTSELKGTNLTSRSYRDSYRQEYYLMVVKSYLYIRPTVAPKTRSVYGELEEISIPKYARYFTIDQPVLNGPWTINETHNGFHYRSIQDSLANLTVESTAYTAPPVKTTPVSESKTTSGNFSFYNGKIVFTAKRDQYYLVETLDQGVTRLAYKPNGVLVSSFDIDKPIRSSRPLNALSENKLIPKDSEDQKVAVQPPNSSSEMYVETYKSGTSAFTKIQSGIIKVLTEFNPDFITYKVYKGTILLAQATRFYGADNLFGKVCMKTLLSDSDFMIIGKTGLLLFEQKYFKTKVVRNILFEGHLRISLEFPWSVVTTSSGVESNQRLLKSLQDERSTFDEEYDVKILPTA